jgi:hypothetical protein
MHADVRPHTHMCVCGCVRGKLMCMMSIGMSSENTLLSPLFPLKRVRTPRTFGEHVKRGLDEVLGPPISYMTHTAVGSIPLVPNLGCKNKYVS